MRFRTRTVLGIAVIQALLLVILVLSVMDRLRSSNETQIEQRANVTAQLLAAAARDSMVAYDVSSLQSLATDLVASGEVAYVRFVDDGGRTMIEVGDAVLRARQFVDDIRAADVGDDTLDREVRIEAAGQLYGHARFGIPLGPLTALLAEARRWAISLSLAEMVLVALFSILLGNLLTRRLNDLRAASQEIAAGNLAHRVDESGSDELAETARAFNRMSDRLLEQYQARDSALDEIRKLASFQRAVLEASDSTIIVTDHLGTIVHFNPAAERLLEYAAREVVGQTTMERFHDPAEVAQHAQVVARELDIAPPAGVEVFVALARHGLSDRHEWHYITRSGRRVPVLLSVSGVYSEDESLLGFMGVAQDISGLKRADERMREAAKVFENSLEAIMVTDLDGIIHAVNPAFTQITGYDGDEVLGQNPRLLKSDRHDPAFFQDIWQTLQERGHWEGEIWNRRKNGEVYPAWQSISCVRDDQGRVVEYVSMFSDISVRRNAEEELRFRAWHDALTSLPNRNLLNEHLRQALREARRGGQKVAVIFIDLDYFKSVNDTLGHDKGDLLLCQAAGRLSDCLRESDMLARQGGDEFVVVLQGVHTAQDAARVVTLMIERLGLPFDLDGHQAHIGASAGITLYPDDGDDSQALYRNADLAMYRAKSAGRNNFQFYTASMTEAALRRRELEIELRHALTPDAAQLEVHYQPIIELASGRLVGAEALIRWRHPLRGWISPVSFIPLAEETCLINPLGRWVLEQTCRDFSALTREGHYLTVSVNISSRQIHNGLSIDELDQLLKQFELPSDRLALEITEGVLLADNDATLAWLKGIHALGIRIDLDDFGTGYSSLAYLKRFPIDRLKIDHSFVTDMNRDQDSLTLIETILAMAKGLRMEVVAEGIEDETQRAALQGLDCTFGQGYLLGRPMPITAFRQALQAAQDSVAAAAPTT